MLEVEVKAHISDFKEIKDKLVEIGAIRQRSEHQEDIYYNAPHKDFAQTDEALRIRKIPRKEGYEIILTYKGAKLDESSKTRQEIEVEIDNPQKMGLILENLGFNPVKTIKKDRTIYLVDEYIITLDKVGEVGNFVEIEKDLTEGEDYQLILDKIFELYNKLGINDGFERRSYLELLELGRK
jgi:adenylate cyclase class 2